MPASSDLLRGVRPYLGLFLASFLPQALSPMPYALSLMPYACLFYIKLLTTSATGFVDRATSTAYIAKLPTASLM